MEDTDYSFNDAMRQRMETWLKQDEPPLAPLCDWLQGYDVPPAGHDLEPFEWILRGIPPGPERHPSEIHLGRAIARLLAPGPHEIPALDRPEEVTYNALKLAAAIGPQRELGCALRELLHAESLSGEWHGADLRRCLLDALIENQFDRKLEPLWSEMLDRTVPETRFLKGGPYDGFQGVLLLPKSEAEPGEPALDAIGGALKALAISFEGRRNKRQRFRDAVQRVTETHRHWPTWDLDLIVQADASSWPRWALESLPSLFVLLRVPEGEWGRVVAWKYILNSRPRSCAYTVQWSLCENRVIEVSAPSATIGILARIAAALEPIRNSHEYPSDHSLLDAMTVEMVIQELEELTRPDGIGELAQGYAHARMMLDEELGVGAIAV
jgi:hypothetical protein